MAGNQNIVESWLKSWHDVLARALARSSGSTPGFVYRHPHIYMCMYIYINKARPRFTTLGASSILFFKYIPSLVGAPQH